MKSSLVACVSLALAGHAAAFSHSGPIGNGPDAYQEPVIGYGLPGDLVAPKNLGEEYRWNTPVLSYAFDQSFLDYFGSNGVYGIEQAIAILNATFSTNVSSWSANLDEFTLNTSKINYRASALGLIDLKSVTLSLLIEELGLTDPVRYAWCLRDRRPVPGGNCPDMLYDVIQRNWDPITFEPSSYVNGTLYTYDIFPAACTGGDPLADAREIPVDAEFELNTPVASLAIGSGSYYTGLTRDDAAGLRYLYRPARIKTELPPPDSQMISGGFTNLDTPQILFTSNLATLVAQSPTNSAAQLQALYPGLIITHTETFFATEVTTNLTAFFTNAPTAPVGTTARLVVRLDTTTNFVFRYRHTFGNVVTNTYYTNMWIQTQNITITNSPTAPVGTTALITNVGPSGKNGKPFLTNLVSGDFYILPANLCGYSVVGSLTYVTAITNIVLQVNATNVAAGTNTGVTNVAGVGLQSFTSLQITWFTNHALAVHPIDCGNNNPALRRGIDRIQFQRADYDSLIGRPLAPITNRFTMTVITNGIAFPQTWERVTAQPDILFTASDLLRFVAERTTPNFVADTAPPGGALAGPGTIVAPFSIGFNKVGIRYEVLGPFTLHQEEAPLFFTWGLFGDSTNAPIVFPSGRSISDLEQMILQPLNP